MHFGPFFSHPVELRRGRPRLDRNAQDHFILDDQARHRRRNRPGIGREQAEQQRNEADRMMPESPEARL